MKKKIIIASIVIVLAVVIIFIGYYPPIYPFLKYGPFSKATITREVFSIDNFQYSPDDVPTFFIEVKKVVRDKWYDDAELISVSVYRDHYEMTFSSPSHPFQLEYPQDAKEEQPSELKVHYSAEVTPDYENALTSQFSYEEGIGYVMPYLTDKFNLLKYRYHRASAAHNQKLIGIECIDKFVCQFFSPIEYPSINVEDIKISLNEVINIVTAKKPEVAAELSFSSSAYLKQISWDKSSLEYYKPSFPYWDILHPQIKVNATTGEGEITDIKIEKF